MHIFRYHTGSTIIATCTTKAEPSLHSRATKNVNHFNDFKDLVVAGAEAYAPNYDDFKLYRYTRVMQNLQLSTEHEWGSQCSTVSERS